MKPACQPEGKLEPVQGAPVSPTARIELALRLSDCSLKLMEGSLFSLALMITKTQDDVLRVIPEVASEDVYPAYVLGILLDANTHRDGSPICEM